MLSPARLIESICRTNLARTVLGVLELGSILVTESAIVGWHITQFLVTIVPNLTSAAIMPCGLEPEQK